MQNIYQLQSLKYQFLNFSIFFCQLQTWSAKALAKLLELCITREPCPNAKIIKNLCSFACSDPSVTPAVNISLTVASDEPPLSPIPEGQSESNCNSVSFGGTNASMERGYSLQCDQYNGILSLVQQQKVLWVTNSIIAALKSPHLFAYFC